MGEKSDDCYIDVWRGVNFDGEMIRICGPAEYPVLQFAQGDWGDDIGSLRVGPNAFVMAYRDQNFKDKMITFGPNDEVADLREFKFDDDIESLKVIDSMKIFDRITYNPDETSEDAGVAVSEDAKPHRKKRNPQKGRRH